jgi:hypothetical protein
MTQETIDTQQQELNLTDPTQPVVEAPKAEIDETKIDFDLALAINHNPANVRICFVGYAIEDDTHVGIADEADSHVEVLTDTDPPTEPQWFRFSHRDPAVAWALAERFDCFPYKTASGNWTTSLLAPSGATEAGVKSAALAVALTVIQEQGL